MIYEIHFTIVIGVVIEYELSLLAVLQIFLWEMDAPLLY